MYDPVPLVGTPSSFFEQMVASSMVASSQELIVAFRIREVSFGIASSRLIVASSSSDITSEFAFQLLRALHTADCF